MASLSECRLFHRSLTYDDTLKRPQCKNVKFKRAFQFLQLLLLQRLYGIDVIRCPSKRRSLKRQQCQFEVFLGGSCNPTTWRHEQAIPYFQSHSVSFYNPQVANWTPDLVEIEHRAKELAPLLFFVIAHDTRSLAAIAEVCYLAACGRSIIVVMNPMPDDKNHTKFIQQKLNSNEKDDEDDYENVCKARRTLRILLQNINVPVFDNVGLALECAAFILETTKRTVTNSSPFDEEKKEDDDESDILTPLPRSPSSGENINSHSPSVEVIRSLSNEKTFESPDDFYREMNQSEMISSSPTFIHRRHSATSIRPLLALNPFFRSIHFPIGLQLHRTPMSTRTHISSSRNESDDDGYDSLASSNRTLSRSSSVSSDFGECSTDNSPTGSYLPEFLFNNLLSIFSSYIPFVNSAASSNSSVTQSIFGLCTLPFRFIKNTLLPSVSSATSIEPTVYLDTPTPAASNSLFDLYIASGDHDECWLNTFAVPVLEEINVNYTKRQSYYDNDQLDDINIRKRSRLLYYIINDNERLSYLATELAFLIGERKHHIIVCLQSIINESRSKILTKTEREDIERSRKYIEDLARRENILLCHSREQSWQHVLAFFL